MEFLSDWTLLWQHLGWPLLRLLFFISIGLLVANFIEALHWTYKIALLARPLIRFGKLTDITGASFSMAFFSGIAANTMLSEAYEKKELSRKELVLANLFNSLPTYFLHLPTTFFITVSLIHEAAFIYIGLTFGAAILRTLSITVLGHFILEKKSGANLNNIEIKIPEERKESIWQTTWKRFKKRIGRICRFTVPIYVLFFLLNQAGVFKSIEIFMAENLGFISWLSPQAFSIIAIHIAAEFTAGLAAAGALLQEGTLGLQEMIVALMIGNIVSSPVRAFRHQFPYYSGIFPTKIALFLIICNQSFRAVSIALVTILYILFA